MDFPVVVFISGRGSNLKSLAAHQENFSIVRVVSDKPDAAGLAFARQQGIDTANFARKDFSSLREQKEAIYQAACEPAPKLFILAGFMQIVEASFVEEHLGKIINIHPSLLPKYPGLDTHRRALEAGDDEHGCSVHFVTPEVDAGPLIAQAVVPIESTDTEESLGARVLAEEHRLFPWCVQQIASGAVRWSGEGPCELASSTREEALKLGFRL